MSALTSTLPPNQWPVWFNGKAINEAIFCQQFLISHPLAYTDGAFFTVEGRMMDESVLQGEIFDMLQSCATSSVTKKNGNIIDLLKITARVEEIVPQDDRIHLANGTLMLDGDFLPYKDQIVRSRFPIQYNPQAGPPERWLRFLGEVLYQEDIPTLQEFIGYCLIPSNKGQRMMIIKGSGGEGKSQIGTVISRLFGCNAKDGSVGKVSENRFARADLEHIHLMIDDDMRMDALKQTNYVKSLVTAQGKMDLEKKNKQSYQGWMYARLLAFSNGDLQALYDRSDGFYRRQLILTTREKPADHVDDPDIARKMCDELEGIFLWAFEGLKRLAANQFHFTESPRAKSNREIVRQDANNLIQFMASEGYIKLWYGQSISSQELYRIYTIWCNENALPALKPRTVSDFLVANQKKYDLEYTNNAVNPAGRRVRGFKGIKAILKLPMETKDGWQKVWQDDNPFEKT